MMTETIIPLDPEVIQHPTTLQVFLTIRLHEDEKLGVRQIQRLTGIKSPSTVSWHLDKLADADYVTKSPDNRYQLSKEAKEVKTIDIPVTRPFKIIRRELVPPRLMIPSMLVFLLLFSLILFQFSVVWGYIVAIGGILSAIVWLLKDYLSVRKYLSELIEPDSEEQD